jgi:hypothetical protein
VKTIILAVTAPTALDKEMKLRSRCLLNVAPTRIGKYRIGTKTIMLPTKLVTV